MNQLIIILTIINSITILYLLYLIIKKYSKPVSEKILTAGNFKIHLTRFNPFSDLGGNQSFILCLLDQSNSGVIITSLHNRDRTRLYAKEIKKGKIEEKLFSPEEKTILQKIIN